MSEITTAARRPAPTGEVGPGTYIGLWEDAAGVEHRAGAWTFVEDRPAQIEILLEAK